MASQPNNRIQPRRPRVIIVGGGFGGLNAAKGLGGAPVNVAVFDRNNYHLFQPLLYQVASAVLSPAEIAEPIRKILNRHRNCHVYLNNVDAVDLARRVVRHEAVRLATTIWCWQLAPRTVISVTASGPPAPRA